MMKRILMSVALAGSMFAFGGCGASCEDVCANAVKVCPDTIGKIAGFEAACVTSCNENDKNTANCTNASEIKSCAASAATCDAFGKCPTCTK